MQEYYNENFTGENLPQIMANIFTACRFRGINLTEKDFSRAVFEECEFIDCNLALIKFTGTKLQQVKFVSTKLLGISFIDCDKLILEMGFEDCIIRECNFSGLEIKGTSFKGSEIFNSDYIGCKLIKAVFKEVKFEDVSFHNSDLSEADFREATGYQINPKNNIVNKAKFDLPEAISFLNYLGILLDS